MPYLNEATLKSNHPIFDDFIFEVVTGGNENLHAQKWVTICFHGVGGNASTIAGWVADTAGVNVEQNNEQVVIAPLSAGGSGWNGWWPTEDSFQGIDPTNTHFAAAIDAGVALVDAVLATGVPMSQIALVGHSQGGCLAIEVALAKLNALGPDADTAPDRFAVVMLTASGCVGMFQDDQADCEEHAWWQNKIYRQKVHIAAKSEDPNVPAVISAFTAKNLADHCGADVTYRVETDTYNNTHSLVDGGFAAEQAILKDIMIQVEEE